MLRIFGHFVPVPAVALGVFEVLLMSASLYLVTAPVDAWHAGPAWQFQLAVVPAQFSVGLSGLAGMSMVAVGLYNYDVFLDYRVMMIKILMALILVAPAALVITILIFRDPPADALDAWTMWFLKATVVWIVCVLVTRTVFLRFSDSELFRRKVVVIGTGVRAARIADLVKRADNRYFVPKAFVHACSDLRLVPGAPLDLDSTEDEYALAKYARGIGAREVVVATDDRRGMPVEQLLHCKLAGINVVDYLTFWERENGKLDIEALQPSWLIYSDGFRQGAVVDAAKRVFDVVVSLALLAFALPVMLVAAILIRCESRGPSLYRQERVGLDGKTFTLLKFRSMRTDAEGDGAPRWAATVDPRATRVGAVIRKFRIDELPQLLNVLGGSMSFVGPRPERPFFVDQLARSIPFYRERHSVKPGITGWAQVNYPYGASLEDARQKLAFDLYYVKNRTLFLDLVILVQTIRVILYREGAR
jgi:sugar transferase (PEP-CTERM system associated)